MAATPFEFRHRYLLHALIYTLGFVAPWNYVLHLDPRGVNAHTWGLLAVNLTQLGVADLSTAFVLLLSLAIASAVLGAGLRTWGGAYLGAPVVQDASMHTAAVERVQTTFASERLSTTPGILTDGPFRWLRNPLYLGTFLHTLALALLMPRSGAIFTIVAIALLQLRLIFAEEAFLTSRLGAPYIAYCQLVPRLLPTLRPRAVPSGRQPRWAQAFLGEIYMWAVAAAFAFAGWRYNATLLLQAVVVAFGLSLVVKALTPRVASEMA